MSAEKHLGDAIVARLSGVKLDARAKAAGRALSAQHKAYRAAFDEAAAREAARGAALAAVGAADERLDAAVSALADRRIGAGLAKRTAPFAGLSDLSPSELTALGYANEVKATTALAKAARKGRPPREVLAACDALDAAAAEVAAALRAYDAAAKAAGQALTARDALLPAWQKTLTRFRVLARASLVDDEGAYEALVAAPEGIAVPKRRSKRTNGAAPSPSA